MCFKIQFFGFTLKCNFFSSPSPGRGFFVPGFDTNNAGFKMMSLTDLMDAAKGVSNMCMAHEIAIDKVSDQADKSCLSSMTFLNPF